MYVYSFEKLEAWKKSRELTNEIYRLTESYPESEKFGLINQMRRGMISVCSNLAEGSSRGTPKDQGHFYQISYSSLMEVLNQLIISYDLKYIENSILSELRERIRYTSFLISKLRKSLQ